MSLQWNIEQKNAIEEIKDWINKKGQPLISLTGPAGAGKTTILSQIKTSFKEPVAWTAMTGKAALRLGQAISVSSGTLHSVLYEPPNTLRSGDLEFSKLNKSKVKYLVVDEASMITPKIFGDLKLWMADGVRVLLVGDPYQLPPIISPNEAALYGDDFSVFRKVTGPELTAVMRSDNDIIKIATHIREKNKIPAISNGSYSFERVENPMAKALQDYLADPEDHMVLTWRNKIRMEANMAIRKHKGYITPLPYANEPVMFCKNGQEILNGEIKIIKDVTNGPLISGLDTNYIETTENKKIICFTEGKEYFMDGASPIIKDWKGYVKQKRNLKIADPVPLTYAYVSTAHKAQGSEFRRVTVFLYNEDLKNPYFNKTTKLPNGQDMSFAIRWLYTSLSRAKQRVTFITEA